MSIIWANPCGGAGSDLRKPDEEALNPLRFSAYRAIGIATSPGRPSPALAYPDSAAHCPPPSSPPPSRRQPLGAPALECRRLGLVTAAVLNLNLLAVGQQHFPAPASSGGGLSRGMRLGMTAIPFTALKAWEPSRWSESAWPRKKREERKKTNSRHHRRPARANKQSFCTPVPRLLVAGRAGIYLFQFEAQPRGRFQAQQFLETGHRLGSTGPSSAGSVLYSTKFGKETGAFRRAEMRVRHKASYGKALTTSCRVIIISPKGVAFSPGYGLVPSPFSRWGWRSKRATSSDCCWCAAVVERMQNSPFPLHRHWAVRRIAPAA